MTAPVAFGLNLSFCVKRWVQPELWVPLVRDRMGVDHVQLSYDLVDPLWPASVLDRHAASLRRETAAAGVRVHSAFIGLAHYTFNQLLHPDPEVRDWAEGWMTRAYAFAAQAGITRVGGPLGAIASRIDGVEPQSIAARDYDDLIARMMRLADRARAEGLTELYVEPTPMRREWPWTIDQARRMMDDVAGSAVPWRYCIDWGHGTFHPLYGATEGRIEPWLGGLADVTTALHIQQTDYQFDRHWDFTVPGNVVLSDAARAIRAAGLGHVPVFLEVFYPFERDDASVIEAVAKSVAMAQQAFGSPR